jgi:hypothetical protein
MLKYCSTVFFLFFSLITLRGQLQSPDEFLPHRLGEQFTPHHMLVNYVEHVAANSPNVQVTHYGHTCEGRPQLLAFVSTPENMARLEEIRQNNLRRAGLLDGTTDESLDLAIVWLGYSVHGNEAAGSESSMAVLYELANPGNTRTQAWLENTLVIIDPSYNPDGYSRYTHWYRGISNRIPDPNPATWEHDEPWPRGRANHYLFDLNRDWAWQTQRESRQRMTVYRQWLPHIHVDIHEQGRNSPYYFAPAAKPFHPYITQWQRNFQTEIGKNNARYFDQNGWLYFTRERFDLFYPSYGDTYPTFSGAIGMTYEQAGIDAGRAIITENGDTLTLRDRIEHHKTTSLATVETAHRNSAAILQNFESFYDDARHDPPGPYKTFIIKGDNPAGRLRAFCELLDKNGIRYGKARSGSSLRAYNYTSGEVESIRIESGDLLISAYQPNGVLTQVLLEPESVLEDSVTYDITAWSLPYAYGLETYASEERVAVEEGYDFENPAENLRNTDQPYAYLATWKSLHNARFLSALLQQGVTVRYASAPFAIEGETYAPGTLVITRADNADMGERFFRHVTEAARQHQQEIFPVLTGFSDSGHDLGAGVMEIIERPEIAVLSREGTSSYSFGQVWYYFEQNLDYPIHIVPAEDLSRLDLEKYNILVMPEGRYEINESTAEKLQSWMRDGGRLIAIGSAVRSLDNVSGFGLKQKNGNGQNGSGVQEIVVPSDYAGQERRFISDIIPGAVFKVDIDNSHPLAFGLKDYYFSLKTNELTYQPLDQGWNVGTLGEELLISGFAGANAQEQVKNTLIFGVEDKGRGDAVYLIDNPLYRAFWENGKFLFSNAVFMR